MGDVIEAGGAFSESIVRQYIAEGRCLRNLSDDEVTKGWGAAFAALMREPKDDAMSLFRAIDSERMIRGLAVPERYHTAMLKGLEFALTTMPPDDPKRPEFERVVETMRRESR